MQNVTQNGKIINRQQLLRNKMKEQEKEVLENLKFSSDESGEDIFEEKQDNNFMQHGETNFNMRKGHVITFTKETQTLHNKVEKMTQTYLSLCDDKYDTILSSQNQVNLRINEIQFFE